MLSEDDFWKSISILLRNFHAVNKKVFASKFTNIWKIQKGLECLSKKFDSLRSAEELRDFFGEGCEHVKFSECPEDELWHAISKSAPRSEEVFVFEQKLITKKRDSVIGIAFVDFNKKLLVFKYFSEDFVDFRIEFISGEICTKATSIATGNKSQNWSDFVLKPKLLKWAENEDLRKDKPVIQSLSLIDPEKYNELYKQLKDKYSQPLLKIWPESTDPLKFIYEDLAIAAYLISLWKTTESEPKAFADLGCGNGLLVYILSEEGYKGYGYDIRRRKIWDLYPESTVLLEEGVWPDTFKFPEDVDWIIGNHSDELSPWVPVMANRSSYRMKYFLLPCCAYEFSGQKFQRRNSKISSYNDFLDYVNVISVKCGFITLGDRLKIPSTKRTALIGIERNYEEAEFEDKCLEIENFVKEENSSRNIKLREKDEPVRNCTQIEKAVINDFVDKIFKFLLVSNEEEEWNCGRKVGIKDLLECLTKEDLKNIKSECGGLKTLLKNKHEIFQLQGDTVQIRKPAIKTTTSNAPLTIKKRSCYFFENHPHGCPLTDSECTFIHSL